MKTKLRLLVCMAMCAFSAHASDDTPACFSVKAVGSPLSETWNGSYDSAFSIGSSKSGFWDDLPAQTREIARPDEVSLWFGSLLFNKHELVLPDKEFRYVKQSAVKGDSSLSEVCHVAVQKNDLGQTVVRVLHLTHSVQPLFHPIAMDDETGCKIIMEDVLKMEDSADFLCLGAAVYLFDADGATDKGQIWEFSDIRVRSNRYIKIKREALFRFSGTLGAGVYTPNHIYINPVIWNDARARRRVADMIMGKEWLVAFYRLAKHRMPGVTLESLKDATLVEISDSGEVTVENGMATFKRFPLRAALRAYLLYYVSRDYPQLPSDFVFYVPCGSPGGRR